MHGKGGFSGFPGHKSLPWFGLSFISGHSLMPLISFIHYYYDYYDDDDDDDDDDDYYYYYYYYYCYYYLISF